VPFDYSMHNFLLRYVVAEAGLDPDKDIQIRAVPRRDGGQSPAGNLDGYLGPDPFNQRAVYENEASSGCSPRTSGRDILLRLRARKDFAESSPNSFGASSGIVTPPVRQTRRTARTSRGHRPRNYLNQPSKWWRRAHGQFDNAWARR